MRRIVRYWHTIKYLRPLQIIWRLKIFLDRRPPNLAKIDIAHRPNTGPWIHHAFQASSQIKSNEFCFLNETGSVSSRNDWNSPQKSKLWLYNLHYFDDLLAEDAHLRVDWHQALIGRWIDENPPGFGNGWEPYPCARRIVNWIAWSLNSQQMQPCWDESLASQARWLRRNIEWHILGNHLLADLKALLFAGCYFASTEAEEWRRTALICLREQRREQLLDDGGHFERSPMYHAAWLADWLQMIALAQTYPDLVPQSDMAHWRATVTDGLGWLAAMTHPDGEIAFFNDAAFGVAPELAHLQAFAARLDIAPDFLRPTGLTDLEESGYCRVVRDGVTCIADLAAIGPDYLPGHAHADTLSFELSLDRDRVLVNSGTSVYGEGEERQWQRSTAAHNTVEVDGVSSSEVWRGFRVARRARIIERQVACASSQSASHDGYKRLPGRVIHNRHWSWGNRQLNVSDKLSGRFKTATARLYLHPDIAVGAVQKGYSLKTASGRELRIEFDGARTELQPATWHSQFGNSQENHVLIAHFTGRQISTCIRW